MATSFDTNFAYQVDVKKFSGHKGDVNCVGFSLDFEILVTGSDDERVRVFNTRTGQMVVRLKGQSAAIKCVAVSPDSAYIASGSYDKTVIIYRTCDASTIHHLTAHLKSVECVTFSYCSKYLCSTSWDRTGILWDVNTGHMLKLFQGHTSLVQCAAFSPCGRMLATGSWDYTVCIWPLKRRSSPKGSQMHKLTAHQSNIHAVVFSCHNILATGSWDKQIILWNPYTGQVIYRLQGHEGWVQALCFSVDGSLLASSADDEMVKIWSVASGECLRTLESRTDTASHCGFHPSGALITTGSAMPAIGLLGGMSADDGTPPHTLDGEEILDIVDIDVKSRRVQSAKPLSRPAEMFEQESPCQARSKSANRPESAVHVRDKLPYQMSVERWLSMSFQQL